MSVHTVRRLAAELLNVGENKVRISADGISEVKSAMTRGDVKALIDKGVVKAASKKGRKKNKRKKRRGSGSRTGKKAGAAKKEWMAKVRSQRKLLKRLIELNALPKEDKRAVYMKVKSGIFRSKRAMITYLKENDYLPGEFELPKEEYVPKKKPVKKKPKEKMEEKPEKKEEKREEEKKEPEKKEAPEKKEEKKPEKKEGEKK